MEDMTVTGKYRIYEDGVLVSEQENLLTTYGKREILKMIAGRASQISRIGVGVMGTAANVADLTLTMPLADADVNFITPIFNGATSKIVYKCRLPENVSGKIYELATYNSPEINEPVLTNFSTVDSPGVTIAGPLGGGSADIRMSSAGINLSSGALTASITKPMSAGSLLSTDKIALAMSTATASVAMSVKFTDIDGKTATATFTTAAGGYQVVSRLASAFTIAPSGATFDWSNISNVLVTHPGGGSTVTLDGLAVLSEQQSGSILSHAIYSTPVEKRLSVRYDIEYELTFNLA